MSNLKVPFDKLDSRAAKAIENVKAHGHAIGVKQNSDTVLTQVLKEARTCETAFAMSYAKRQSELTPAFARAQADAMQYFNASKKILKLSLGEKWNPRWGQVGFVDGSIRTPETQEEREALLLAMAAYFKANPEREVAAVQATAARGLEIHAALSSARAARDAHDVAHRKLSAQRKEATETLRKRLRGLQGELATLLSKDDPRWAAFGFAPRMGRKRKATPSAASQEIVALEVKAAA